MSNTAHANCTEAHTEAEAQERIQEWTEEPVTAVETEPLPPMHDPAWWRLMAEARREREG
jgi:hypothetical protein